MLIVLFTVFVYNAV